MATQKNTNDTNAGAFPQAAAPQLVTKNEIAQLAKVSHRTVDNWIKRKTVPYLKIGGSIRFNVAEVMAALSRFTVKAVTLD